MASHTKTKTPLKHSQIPINGIRLHVVEAGPMTGPLLIFLHGFPEFWYGWHQQIDHFAKAGFHVVVPDQRGYNLSEKPKKVSDYNLDCLAEDAIGLIDHYKAKKAILVGHDWGGAVAWWAAHRFPERIEKLVILNVPHHQVMRKYLFTHPSQMLRSWYMFFFQLPFLPELFVPKSGRKGFESSSRPGTFSSEDFAAYEESWRQPGALTGMINWYRAGLRCPPRKKARGRIQPPTLLIWGKKDVFLKHEMAQPSIDLCDDGKLVFLEEAGHWLAHEEPETVNRLIQEHIS